MLLDNNRRTVITVTIAKYDEARYVIIIIDKYMFYDIITRGKVAFSSERRWDEAFDQRPLPGGGVCRRNGDHRLPHGSGLAGGLERQRGKFESVARPEPLNVFYASRDYVGAGVGVSRRQPAAAR